MPHRRKHIQQPSPDLDDLLDWVDDKVGAEEVEEGLAAIELGIFEQKDWSKKQRSEISARVKFHAKARKVTDKLGREYFHATKDFDNHKKGQFVRPPR